MKIGVTGGVGCGVSEVTGYLKTRGARVVSGDGAGHRVLQRDDVKQALIRHFGPDITDPQGNINRRKLGSLVFSSDDERRELNQIVHPTLLKILQEEVDEGEKRGEIVVVDAALIFEWGLQTYFDAIIVVAAPLEMRIQRVMRRDRLSRAQVVERINAQIPLEEKAKQADFVIINDGTWDDLHRQADAVWEKIRSSGSGTSAKK